MSLWLERQQYKWCTQFENHFITVDSVSQTITSFKVFVMSGGIICIHLSKKVSQKLSSTETAAGNFNISIDIFHEFS